MDEIQKDYLIGLVLKELDSFDEEALKKMNINSAQFNESIEKFIYKCSTDNNIAKKILDFLNSDENNFNYEDIQVEKIDENITTNYDGLSFTLKKEDYQLLVTIIEGYFTEYLPLGSIVKLKNDNNLIMIEQRMVRPKDENYYIDYRAIPYPMGVFNESMYIYFNADEITEIIFTGYNDPENKGYELALKESLIDNKIFKKED